MGHYARDCQAEEKMEETINLALDDATSWGILLMAQNEEPNTKRDGGAKDDGDSREVVEVVWNEVIRSRFGEIAVSETRELKKDKQPDNRELELEERQSSNGRKGNSRKKKERGWKLKKKRKSWKQKLKG